MLLYTVFADLGNDRIAFHGNFSTKEKANAHIKKVNEAYGFKCCYFEENELDKE